MSVEGETSSYVQDNAGEIIVFATDHICITIHDSSCLFVCPGFFSEVVACMGLKLGGWVGGWVELGPT